MLENKIKEDMLRKISIACLVSASIASVGCMKSPPPPPKPETVREIAKADPEMKAVLDELQKMPSKPIETLTPAEARKQPTLTDAVMARMKTLGMSTTPEKVGKVDNTSVKYNGKKVKVRVYSPEGKGPYPVIVYVHGGGWVIADLNTYDASARALTNLTQAVVVSVDYRQAPEYKFPAAHEDVYTVTQWALNNAKEIKGDPKRVAIVGESAGGNIAAAVSLMAKDMKGKMPIYEVLVYPIAGFNTDTPSYRENAAAKPLNKPMMEWFTKQYLNSEAEKSNKYVSLLSASTEELKGLPPTTIITAEIDPLMSDGKILANKLTAAGVPVAYRSYDGVTHEFFGAASVITKAKEAEKFAADGLVAAFKK